MNQIIPTELALWKRAGFAHALLDVRRTSARERDGTDIADASWRDARTLVGGIAAWQEAGLPVLPHAGKSS